MPPALLEAVDGTDVRVVEGRERARLAAPETRDAVRVPVETGRQILNATSRPSFKSRARITFPIPPAPIFASMR